MGTGVYLNNLSQEKLLKEQNIKNKKLQKKNDKENYLVNLKKCISDNDTNSCNEKEKLEIDNPEFNENINHGKIKKSAIAEKKRKRVEQYWKEVKENEDEYYNLGVKCNTSEDDDDISCTKLVNLKRKYPDLPQNIKESFMSKSESIWDTRAEEEKSVYIQNTFLCNITKNNDNKYCENLKEFKKKNISLKIKVYQYQIIILHKQQMK